MNIRPLHDRVVIKPWEENRPSPAGIVIPDTAAEKPMKGEVIAVGIGKLPDNVEACPLDVTTGGVAVIKVGALPPKSK